MGILTLSKDGIVNDKATRLYKDMVQAERELNEFVKYSMTLEDLETVQELQIEVQYRLSLFNDYIQQLEEE